LQRKGSTCCQLFIPISIALTVGLLQVLQGRNWSGEEGRESEREREREERKRGEGEQERGEEERERERGYIFLKII
jgi:hypothetical protein